MRSFIVLILTISTLCGQNTKSDFCEFGFEGVHVLDIESGGTIYEKNQHKLLTPASSLKLLTSLLAIRELGEEFVFKTQIGIKGKRELGGILKGDLVVKADGDPTLASKRINGDKALDKVLNNILMAIKENGINCVDGNLILDISGFSEYPIISSWPVNDIGNYYASGSWALNILENEYDLHFDTRGDIGMTPQITDCIPEIENLQFTNRLKIADKKSGDQAYIYNGPYIDRKELIGTLPQGHHNFKIRGTMPNPHSFFMKRLAEYLTINNIGFQEIEIIVKEQSLDQVIKVFESPSLVEMIYLMNTYSINLYAEAFNNKLTSRNGLKTTLDDLVKMLLGKKELIAEPIELHDGSGLSPKNKISPFTFTHLIKMGVDAMGFEQIINLMPQASTKGTVRNFLKEDKIAKNVWLKSGSMDGVLSYTGMIRTKTNKLQAFSFIYNNCESSKTRLKRKTEAFIRKIFNEDI